MPVFEVDGSMRDPYTVLGIGKTASAAEIKKAFRKRAKVLHPDSNTKDPAAAQKFSELNSAYEIIGDEKKRQRFDAGEIDAEGKERFTGFPGGAGGAQGFEGFNFDFGSARGARGPRPGRGGGGFEDIFSGLFGGGGGFQSDGFAPQSKAQDVSATLHLSFLEAARGTERQLSLSNGRTLKVNVPAGSLKGSVLRLKGQAGGAQGQTPGDVLLTIDVADHPFLRNQGKDVYLNLPITLDEAILGSRIRVPTLSGPVEMTIPPGSNSGKVLRLKGKGMAAKGVAGDFYVILAVTLPDDLDAALKDYAANLRATAPYTVRGSEFNF